MTPDELLEVLSDVLELGEPVSLALVPLLHGGQADAPELIGAWRPDPGQEPLTSSLSRSGFEPRAGSMSWSGCRSWPWSETWP
jgi:hypothetical protein